MRKVVAILIAGVAVLCLIGVVMAFAMAPKAVQSAGHERLTVTPGAIASSASSSATPAPPGTAYTTDATIGDIPSWINPTQEPFRAHSIHVWLATEKCMQKKGYRDFHYRVFWVPQDVARDSENFWTDGMSAADATTALTEEFGPTLTSASSDGCHGTASAELQHQFLDGH